MVNFLKSRHRAGEEKGTAPSDHLDTVLDAIRQGRTITKNIEKSLEFLISSNLSEILTVLGAVALTGTSPLTPMQLL